MPLVSPRRAVSKCSGVIAAPPWRPASAAASSTMRRARLESASPSSGGAPRLPALMSRLAALFGVLRQERGGLGRQALPLAQQRQQQVLGADLGVSEALGLFAGGGQDAAGALGRCRFGHASRGEVRGASPRR